MSKQRARRPTAGRRPEREKQPATVGGLEATMDAFYAEMRSQIHEFVYRYHMDNIEPRLRRMEMIWFRRLWYDLKPLRSWVKSKFQKKIEEPATTTPICTCGVEPEHTMGGDPECKYIMRRAPDGNEK